jgi:hypothetical protein
MKMFIIADAYSNASERLMTKAGKVKLTIYLGEDKSNIIIYIPFIKT